MIYSTWINQFHSVILILCILFTYVQSDVPRPRGVSLSKAPLYSPTKDFTCFDGTITIPFSYVNDDFCDCFDGSDEPGTSACLNGFFHCTNAGHRPLNIPSSRVNDGVCDCCDGSDEWAQDEPVLSCANTCEELGREARAEAQRLAELYKAGSHLRVQLIEKGNSKRSEMAEQLQQLEKDRTEAAQIKDEKENLKNELEAKENEALKVYREADEKEKQKRAEEEKQNSIKEALEYFSIYDINHDEVLTMDEIILARVFDKDNSGNLDEEELKYFFGEFGENDSVNKDDFITSTWAMLKPLLMAKEGLFKPVEEHEDVEQENDADEGSDLDGEYTGQDDEASDLDLPQDEQEEQEQQAEAEQTNVYDDETQKLVDEATEARRLHTDAERTVREIEANIRKIQQSLEKDYGLQQEYATLDGECWEYEDKEYVYKLCVFQKVTQKAKNGGAEVGLGNWGEWAGPDHNKYSIMKYTNGIACWNGPSRLTTVHISCGLETKLLSVTEPYRCEYKMEFSTPAACDESNPTAQHSSHDEL